MAEPSSDNPTDKQDPPAAEEEEEEPQIGLLGLCIGCCCCLLLSPIIVCCCCCQGANTAVQKAQGKRWDSKQRQWVIDNLVEEETTLQNIPTDDEDILKLAKAEAAAEEEAPTAADLQATGNVKETAYYEALGVAPDAEDKAIKRAYYIQARKWHPDKNDSDEAEAKFQQIGEAYQVLSDPQLRAVYDKEGKDGLSGDRTEVSPEKLDPALVFTFLFGSDAFESIVGRLQLVTQLIIGDPAESRIGQEQYMELERRRVLRLALKLRDRVQKHVEGDQETARAEWTADAERLVEVRYGEEILNTVGASYRLVATQCIGSWGEGMEAKLSEQEMQREAAVAAMAGAKNMQKEGEDEGGDDKLPSYIEMMWNVTVIDITTTLREVVLKVCLDKSVEDSAIRKKRAEAIKALGEIWEKQKSKKENKDRRSMRGLYQSAAQAAMEETLQFNQSGVSSPKMDRSHVVREAVISDVSDLLELATSVSLSSLEKSGDDLDQTGFLVSDFTTQDYTNFVETAQHFLVLHIDGVMAAFLLAYGSESITPEQELNSHIKTDLYTDPFVLIKQIVVSPQYRRMGLAQELYLALYRRMAEYYRDEQNSSNGNTPPRPIYTAIVSEPPNPVSINFHEKLGFEQVDEYTPQQDPKPRYIFANRDVAVALEKHSDTSP